MKRERKKRIIINRVQELCDDLDKAKIGYGYADFCRICDIDYRTLRKFINESDYDFAINTVYRIAKSTGVSIDWLVGLSDNKYRGDK